jgi:nucleotide-binding universal stress UspA family protein
MIRSILVPLDGSRFSEMALPVAVDLARKSNASMRLVMVHEPILAMVPAWSEKEDPEERAHELEYLASLSAGVDLRGTAPSYEVIVGDARTALMETAEQTHTCGRRAVSENNYAVKHPRARKTRKWSAV